MIRADAIVAQAEAVSAESSGTTVHDAVAFLLGTSDKSAEEILHAAAGAAGERYARWLADGLLSQDTGIVVAALTVGLEFGVAAERCRQRGIGRECVFHPGAPAVTENGCGPICEVCDDRDREARVAIEQERSECEESLDLGDDDEEQDEAA